MNKQKFTITINIESHNTAQELEEYFNYLLPSYKWIYGAVNRRGTMVSVKSLNTFIELYTPEYSAKTKRLCQENS